MANEYEEQTRIAQEKYRKWRMCQSKRAFKTYSGAKQKGQRVYKCPHCGMFHRASANPM